MEKHLLIFRNIYWCRRSKCIRNFSLALIFTLRTKEMLSSISFNETSLSMTQGLDGIEKNFSNAPLIINKQHMIWLFSVLLLNGLLHRGWICTEKHSLECEKYYHNHCYDCDKQRGWHCNHYWYCEDSIAPRYNLAIGNHLYRVHWRLKNDKYAIAFAWFSWRPFSFPILLHCWSFYWLPHYLHNF